MRKFWLPFLCGVAILASCGRNESNNNVKTVKTDSTAKTDSVKHGKLVIGLANDTNRHNFTDTKGRRQGYWLIKNYMVNLPGYDSNAKVEEGVYKDGMREGEWIEYNADGSVKSTTTFKNDKPVN